MIIYIKVKIDELTVFFFFNFPIGAARTVAPREPCSEKRGAFYVHAFPKGLMKFLKYGKRKLQNN